MSGVTEQELRTVVSAELLLRLRQTNLSPDDEDTILASVEKAFRNMTQIRSLDVVSVRAWCSRILRNTRLDILEFSARHPNAVSLSELAEFGEEPATSEYDPARILVDNEATKHTKLVNSALAATLSELSAEQRRLFEARFYHDIPYSLLASERGISQEATAMRYFRLRDRVFRTVARRLRGESPATFAYFCGQPQAVAAPQQNH